MSTELSTVPHQVKQFSPGKILLLHLIPGILIAAAYFLVASSISFGGYPKSLVFGIITVLVLVPIELGTILYFSKQANGTFSIGKMIAYRERVKLKDYLIFVPLLFVWLGIIFAITKPLVTLLLDKVFYWMPEIYFLNENFEVFSKTSLIATFLSFFLLTGLIAPIVEELYFRGFLLPRMSCFGKYAPLANAFLFAVYHFWSPWMIITRTLGILPMAYIVNMKKNIYIAIIVHCMLNILGDALGILVLILSM